MTRTSGRMEKLLAGRWDNEHVALGIYISVPFCKTKCSYCNFASDVFSRAVFEKYVERVCGDVGNVRAIAGDVGAAMDIPTSRAKNAREMEHPDSYQPEVDSIYLGGGTPTVLEAGQLQRVFEAVRKEFAVQADAEV